MILGMSLPTFTLFHVIISLIGVGSGLIVLFGMLASKRLGFWTAIFLITTVVTSLTGYLFPFEGFKPSYVIGALSLIALLLAILGRYVFHLAGGWRKTYVISAIIALYFNVFVTIFQSFLKIPALHALAPKGSEPPFAISQLVVMILFIALGIIAVKKFRTA